MQIESENFHSQIQFPSKSDRISKKEIANKINEIAPYYKKALVNKTFLFLFEGENIEVRFKAENFLHLCGVETNHYISPKEFYRNACSGKLTAKNIFFSKEHTYKLGMKKITNLMNMIKLVKQDALIITDLYTKTKTYKLATTDCNVLICLDISKNNNQEEKMNILVPYSLRVEDVPTSRFDKIYEVDYVLSKETGSKEYNTIEFGNQFILDEYLEKHNITKYNIKIKHNYSDNNENENDMPQIKQEETLVEPQSIEQSIENVPINDKSKENIIYEKSNQDINDDISEEYDDDFDIEL